MKFRRKPWLGAATAILLVALAIGGPAVSEIRGELHVESIVQAIRTAQTNGTSPSAAAAREAVEIAAAIQVELETAFPGKIVQVSCDLTPKNTLTCKVVKH